MRRWRRRRPSWQHGRACPCGTPQPPGSLVERGDAMVSCAVHAGPAGPLRLLRLLCVLHPAASTRPAAAHAACTLRPVWHVCVHGGEASQWACSSVGRREVTACCVHVTARYVRCPQVT